MIDFSFFELLSLFLFFSSLFILIKLYYIDPLHSKNIFGTCIKKENFINIDPIEITADIYPLKKVRNKNVLEKITRAIYKKDDDREIYILEIEKKTFAPKNSFILDYYSVVITKVNTIIKKDTQLIPRINHFISSKIEQDDIELSRLNNDFKFYFNIFSEKDYIVYLPELLQLDIIQFRELFPLSEKKGAITTMIKLNPFGFSIICNRVSSHSEMENLYNLRNIIEANVV